MDELHRNEMCQEFVDWLSLGSYSNISNDSPKCTNNIGDSLASLFNFWFHMLRVKRTQMQSLHLSLFFKSRMIIIYLMGLLGMYCLSSVKYDDIFSFIFLPPQETIALYEDLNSQVEKLLSKRYNFENLTYARSSLILHIS